MKRPSLDELAKKVENVPAALMRQRYPCPDCGDLYSDINRASECCQETIRTVFVCTKCVSATGGNKGDEGAFDDERDCIDHIDTAHGIAAETNITDRYITALREGKASNQWAFEMAHTTEFLIPNDRAEAR